MPLNLLTDRDGFGKMFLMPHDLSRPKGGLVLEHHNYADKERGTPLARALSPSRISYEPKINIRTVQGKRNRAGARVAMGER